MVEKPPHHTYDIYLEVEAHGGYGGIWRPFYLSLLWSERVCVSILILFFNLCVTSQPARVWFRQNIRHSKKVNIFWKLFVCRIRIAIQNGPMWVLHISDFFKLLFSKLRNEEK